MGELNAVEIFKKGVITKWVCGTCASKTRPEYNMTGKKKFKTYAMGRAWTVGIPEPEDLFTTEQTTQKRIDLPQ